MSMPPSQIPSPVPNVTTAFDTVLRNLVFEPEDVIACFDRAYDSFLATCRYISETTPVKIETMEYDYSKSDDYVCNAFEEWIQELKANGKRPRIALLDTLSTTPSVPTLFERLVKLCKKHDVMSCVDAAHGVGMIPLDLQELDADFFMSNCHKWLHVPRQCAVLVVPVRNQQLLRTTISTSTPEPGKGRSTFEPNFAYVGTLNDNPYLCIEAALLWRSKLTWNALRGEAAIMGYIDNLAREGGQLVAQILGTEVLEDEEVVLRNYAATQMRLPIDEIRRQTLDGVGEHEAQLNTDPDQVSAGIMKAMIQNRHTAISVQYRAGSWWARLSAQVYLTLEDYEHAGKE